jgi:tetratricopeptide (TPR) repeat protein
MHLRQSALAAFATVCVAASVAEAGTVQAKFARLEAEASYYTLVTLSGKRYKVSATVYGRYKKFLRSLKAKDEIVLIVKGDSLLEIKRKAVGGAVARVSLDATFERFDEKAQRIWLRGGRNFGVGKLPGRTMARLLTLPPRQRIRLILERNLVIDLAVIKKSTTAELPAVKRILDASASGDEIQLRKLKDPQFYEYKVRTVRATEVILSPRVAGRFPAGTKITFQRSEIAEIVSPAAQARLKAAAGGGDSGGGEEQADPFSDVRVGDMIGVGFDKGQLISLDEKTYTLRGWRNGRWDREIAAAPRASAKSVRFEPLAHSQTVNVEGGQITLEVKRYRNAEPSKDTPSVGLRFEVVISHNVKTALLVGFEVRYLLSRKPCMAPDAKQDGAVVKTVDKALFVEQRHEMVQSIPGDEFVDGRVELHVLPRHVIDLSAEGARKHLIKALERWNQPLDATAGALRAASANGDPNLCRVLIAHTVVLREHLRTGKSQNEIEADLELELRKSLDDFGETTPKLIMETLFGQDRRLRHWTIRSSGIEQVALPNEIKPLGYKRGLIQLLATLDTGLKGVPGRRLFDLYLERSEDFKDEIIQAFRGQPEAAVSSLLHVAIDIKDKEKADRATVLLRGLGQPILPALFADLRRRKVDPSKLEARLKAGKNPEIVVSEAVGLLVRRAHEDAGRERLRLVKLADEARAQGDFKKAIEIVRGVLAQKKRHTEASALLPQILLEQGRRLMSDGKRGLAAISLQEAAETFTGPAAIQPRKILATMLVDGADEEIDALVIRSAPHPAAEVVAAVKFASQLESSDSTASAFDEWVAVQTKDGKEGYVRSKIVSKAPTGFRVSSKVTPYAILEAQLDEAKKFDPGTAARIKVLMGRLAAREGEIRYLNGEFEAALAFFDTAKADAPDDPRLGHYTACWAKANTALLGGIAAVILLGIGFGVLAIFSRPKKVKYSGEYKHYGQDRVRETDREPEA